MTVRSHGPWVVDTSAAFAAIVEEPCSADVRALLAASSGSVISAASVAELGVVFHRRFAQAPADLATRFVEQAGLDVVPVDERLARGAIEAHRRFGAGRHPARLNYGDCFTYATAAMTGLPILCTGDDFAQTDLAVRRP